MERVLKAGESFWEPGSKVIHHRDGNTLDDAASPCVVTMVCAPGRPMLGPVGEEEREHPGASRP